MKPSSLRLPFIALLLALSAAPALAQTSWNQEFLATLPKITSSADLDRYLATLPREPAAPPAGKEPLYRIQTFAGGPVPVLLEDGGMYERYVIWLQKGRSGKFDQHALVKPSMHDAVYRAEGRVPLDAKLRRKMRDAKGFTDEDLNGVLAEVDIADGRISVHELLGHRLLGGYRDGQWFGPRTDPEIEAYYQEMTRFTNGTSSANASPKVIISANAVDGSKLVYLALPR